MISEEEKKTRTFYVSLALVIARSVEEEDRLLIVTFFEADELAREHM